MDVDSASHDDSEQVRGHSDPQPAQSRDHRDARVAELARRQHGVVARSQLYGLGLSRDDIRGRIERGVLHVVHRGVYAVGHRNLTRDGRLKAALCACGQGAFLSHRTAAALHGLREMNLWRLDVTVPVGRVGARPGLRLHRTTRQPHRHDVRSTQGIRVATVARTLVDLAASETEQELTRLITVAVRKRVLAHDRLEAAIARSARVPGIAKLKQAYGAYRPRPDRKSSLERAFDLLLEQHPEIPPPLRNVHLLGWEVDYHWPAHGVVLELDGRPYHLAVADIERDRLKDAKLLAAGIQPLRVTDRRFDDDPTGVIADLLATLRRGHRDGAGPLAGAA